MDISAYEQLEMERGVCTLQRTYSPEFVQRKALESPSALLAIVGRTAEIAIRLGTFYGSLVLDTLNGTSNEPECIRLRAAQLRCVGGVLMVCCWWWWRAQLRLGVSCWCIMLMCTHIHTEKH